MSIKSAAEQNELLDKSPVGGMEARSADTDVTVSITSSEYVIFCCLRRVVVVIFSSNDLCLSIKLFILAASGAYTITFSFHLASLDNFISSRAVIWQNENEIDYHSSMASEALMIAMMYVCNFTKCWAHLIFTELWHIFSVLSNSTLYLINVSTKPSTLLFMAVFLGSRGRSIIA